ncbi:MAG: sigma-54-dependent Fis family transcriptional regulator [Bacteroidetes bacterium GWF2_38_335]|nr:MAG: sigma-54-dependent Fis family transcriptional regulator [Bacteroidetes bacterium GWF2_38_335]OFY77662.1 MAG: sigma-54-dependent Fis family transcriptional regulator [Bacteroidetes bacterium RIFOXYA12_FULL_38_20]HBS89110.1 sigma-54-dependent Fis family transcriptional regulator [Bacteroidales bacterium]
MADVQQVKQRFGVIGNNPKLNRAIEVAIQVAPTDLSVLVTGQSGTGKEVFPQIIHQFSARKHGQYFAVNCGAIPEGTIDSELFGHEKGSFTGAHEKRKGYFEVADGGTIFLDEVAELPLNTQVRLLRVLETGEFMKVGSSSTLKTNVRVVAATNVNVQQAIRDGKFREDLYYRLNSVPISVPPLKERKEDIHLLFRKFAHDFGERYRMPAISLTPEAVDLLNAFPWPGNIRQLKNITEQISVIEQVREINGEKMRSYLPFYEGETLPVLANRSIDEKTFANEREILYKVLFDMKKDMNDLKKLVAEIMAAGGAGAELISEKTGIIHDLYNHESESQGKTHSTPFEIRTNETVTAEQIEDTEEYIEESLSLEEKEKEFILKALERHNGKRKFAARELGISERTLYRKLKEYGIE